MKNLYKALLVWLLLVAIPFQGFAAASMPACAPAPMSAMPAHCAEMATAMQDDSDHGSPHQHATGKCHTCASCFGAVMAPPMPVLHVPGETSQLAAFRFTGGHLARVDLALPERPPKTVLI